MNLLYFPFSGASKYSYHSFKPYLQGDFTSLPLELPGRGGRIKEGLIYSMHEAVEDLYYQVLRYIHQPFVFYGHSLGCHLAYLVARKLMENQKPLPLYLFLSGSTAPSVDRATESLRYQLPQEEFYKELKSYGGTQDEILLNAELMAFMEPILRADFQILETYQYPKDRAPLPVPFYAFKGQEEDITEEEAMAWQKETSTRFSYRAFSGKHFFIYEHEKEIVSIIKAALEKVMVEQPLL
ncbi:alpha/beta fold hydrolase [Rapidithrix thailandica]|uniref:Alpha/beta fold hydrolase n=1 Tax=Rapidithrix thailandica TaxID=413964 RepID=A0AAW9S5Z3_9BACT